MLLGLLPVVAIGAFVLVGGEEKKVLERRSDPANADRLGYTEEEVMKMDEMTALRYKGDLKEFMAEKQLAAENGVELDGLTWLADKAAKKSKGGYFDGDEVETAGATRF